MIHRGVIPEGGTHINLSGPCNAGVGVLDHFLPMSDPAGKPAKGKEDREHVRWETHRPVEDTGVEIDIRVKFAFDEVGIGERDFLESLRDIKDRIVDPQLIQNLITVRLQNHGSWVITLIDPMTEPHELKGVTLIFGFFYVFFVIAAIPLDILEHFDHRLVGAPV